VPVDWIDLFRCIGNHHGEERFYNLSVLRQFDQCKGSPTTLVTIAIALAAVAIALSVTRHPRHRHHRPIRCHRRHSPATLNAITIALFVAIAVHSHAILVNIAITLPPSP
jgi:hypothetical protein